MFPCYCSHLFKDLVSKYGGILRSWDLGLRHMNLEALIHLITLCAQPPHKSPSPASVSGFASGAASLRQAPPSILLLKDRRQNSALPAHGGLRQNGP